MLTRLRALVARLLDGAFILRCAHEETALAVAPADSVYPFKRRCLRCLRWTPDDRVWQVAPRRPRG